MTEIKGYLILLLAELAERRGDISAVARITAQATILDAVRQSWEGGLSRKKMEEAYGGDADKLSVEIDLADQLAHVMVSAQGIDGNPRLIKRFLNNLMIRNTIAKAQGLSLIFDQLVKLQLFERCAPTSAFEYFVKHVAEQADGKATFIAEAEKSLAKGDPPEMPDPSWEHPFISNWLKLNPKLGDVDLRPLLHLSRDRALSLASFDELSTEGRAFLEGILVAEAFMPRFVDQLRDLGKAEAERILIHILRRARENQWDLASLVQGLHVPLAFPALGRAYVRKLNEIPPSKRPAPLIPHLRDQEWAKDLLKRWSTDGLSPQQVKNAITVVGGKKS